MIDLFFKDNKMTKNFLKAVDEGFNCSVFGLGFGEKSLLLNEINKPIVIVSNSYTDIKKYKEQFECFNKKTKFLLFKTDGFLLNKSTDKTAMQNWIDTLTDLVENKVDVLIVSPEIFMEKLPDKKTFKKALSLLKVGNTINREDLIQNLNNYGFKREEMVNSVGDYSVRGDIIDIFPCNLSSPVRVQLFDELVEQLEFFDLTNFKSIKKIERVVICPNTLYFINDNQSQLINSIKEQVNFNLTKLNYDAQYKLKGIVEELFLHLENKQLINAGWVAPFLNYNSNILNYFKEEPIIVFDDTKQIFENTEFNYNQYYESLKILMNGGEILPEHEKFYFEKSKALDFKNQKIGFQHITTDNKIFKPQAVFNFKSSPLINYFGRFSLLLTDINYFLKNNYTILLYAKNLNKSNLLQNFFLENKLESNLVKSETDCKTNEVNIICKDVKFGGNFVDEKFVVIGSVELFGKTEKQIMSKKKSDVFTLPKINDYVVHEVFGIGKCVGIEKLKFTDYEKDYVILEYDKGDKLYLPTEQIGLISAYFGTGKTPKLNRLGSQDFVKTKERIKESIKELAFNLLKLYAERESVKGFKYEIDEMLLNEFKNLFPYAETLDQTEAIKDIKKDMLSGKIMDRIICGDVGYGKTEVALRAAYIALLNGKQVAFLAPTTILSEQHYNTCLARFANGLANIQVLNRFKTKAQQKSIIKELQEGKVDIICGTHRLLSNDVKFKNLGLLILDEEQRFGVADKEKIKLLKSNVDVLTLSATPIPRTLHMGLVGIRDISLISTPPEGRLPVQTVVSEYSDSVVVQAINRELMRSGQILIIYNRIDSIYSFAEKIKKLLPEDIVLDVAHGQMQEKILEKSIMNLYSGLTQVLISTTLIENGVDLPNANTLIVVDADKLGLSTLYQLRGRVGRSKNMGYAYFMYNPNKIITQEAQERLNAIMDFTELGSGFKIALKDMEIRGCGNIMGKEQHGHMEKIGYDLYCKILNEAVAEIRGAKGKVYNEVKIEISLDAFIPNSYITDSENRFRIYKNLITINSLQTKNEILKEIEDIYGKLPQEVENLSKIALIRSLGKALNIKRIVINKINASVEFYDKNLFESGFTKTSIDQNWHNVLMVNGLPIINFNFGAISVQEKIDKLIKFLINLVGEDKNN